MLVCMYSNLEMVQLLLKYVPTFDADLRDSEGCTMIYHAVAGGPKETIQFLLESRQKLEFDLEARDNIRSTVLHFARKRDMEIVDLVIKALEEIGSDINLDTENNHQTSPFILFCVYNPDVTIQLLQRFPEKINVLSPHNGTILHYACQHGHLDLLKYIFENATNNMDFNSVNDFGWTPLHSASAFGKYEIVKFLFENHEAKGIDVTIKTSSGDTAEDLARRDKSLQRIVEVLEVWTNHINEKHSV